MSKAWKERFFLLVFCVLMLGGLTFLLLSFLHKGSDNTFLSLGLGCIAVCNFMNLYRIRKRNNEKQ